jgi:hypothetical protein
MAKAGAFSFLNHQLKLVANKSKAAAAILQNAH